MREIWLLPNRRAIVLASMVPLCIALVGAMLLLVARTSEGAAARWVGVAVGAAGLIMQGLVLGTLRRPRIAYEAGHVLFYLRRGGPLRVPVEVVEAFIVGQGPADLPVLSYQPKTWNLIARLSRRHPEWAERNVKAALGQWADGYVTVRGVWCEPLTSDVVHRLNRRLEEVKSSPP